MTRLASVALLLALAGASCSSAGAAADELRVLPLAGEVMLVSDGERSAIDEETSFEIGSSIVTGPGGWAEVMLPGGRRLELAPQAELALPQADEPLVERGDLLVRAPEAGIRVRAGDVQVEAHDSVFRVERESSVLLKVYSGEATVIGSGVDPVAALRQATILSFGRLIRDPGPLIVSASDQWDAELLGPAIDLGTALAGLERGLSRQLPRGEEARTIGGVLRGDVPPAVVQDALRVLAPSPAAVMVAAVLAEQASRLLGTPLGDVLEEMLALRALGAHWILLVAQWGLAEAGRSSAVLGSLETLTSAVARFVEPKPAPAQASSSSSGSSTGGGTGVGPGGSASNTGGGGDPGSGGGPGGKDTVPPDDAGGGGEPPPEEPPPDDSQCANEVDCVIDDLIGGTP